MTTEPGLYIHHKGPLYVVLGTVTNSTNVAVGEKMVLYYSVDRGPTNMHVRTETEFHEEIDVEGTKMLRFKKAYHRPLQGLLPDSPGR